MYVYIYIYIHIYICIYIYIYIICSPSPEFFLAPFPFPFRAPVCWQRAPSAPPPAVRSRDSTACLLRLVICHNPGCMYRFPIEVSIGITMKNWVNKTYIRNTTGCTANNMIFECLRIGYMVYPILWSFE